MVKNYRKIFFILFSIILFYGCFAKKDIKIIHDPLIANKIDGPWFRKLVTDTQINSSIDGESTKIGIVRNESITKQSFLKGQQFQIIIKQNFISFTPSIFLSKEELKVLENYVKLNFCKNLKIIGNYSISKEYIEFIYEKVIFDTGEELSFEEYLLTNPSFGTKKQVVIWKIENESLVLTTLDNKTQTKFSKEVSQ